MTTRQGSYKPSVIPQVTVEGLGADGMLDVTGLFPVSGHVGRAEAAEYARTNVYDVTLTDATGKTTKLSIDATGYVTPHRFAVHIPVGTSKLTFTPRATSVGGFASGRTIELVRDAN